MSALLVGCGHRSKGPTTTTTTTTTTDTAGSGSSTTATGTAGSSENCKETTCSACVGEGGCWWHTDTNTCTLDMQGCKDGVNCVNNNDHPCPQ